MDALLQQKDVWPIILAPLEFPDIVALGRQCKKLREITERFRESAKATYAKPIQAAREMWTAKNLNTAMNVQPDTSPDFTLCYLRLTAENKLETIPLNLFRSKNMSCRGKWLTITVERKSDKHAAAIQAWNKQSKLYKMSKCTNVDVLTQVAKKTPVVARVTSIQGGADVDANDLSWISIALRGAK